MKTLRAGQYEDRIPVGARFSAPVQTCPGGHPASCTMGTALFLGAKRPGRGVYQPPPLAPSTGILSLLTWAFMACSRVNFTLTLR